MKTPLIIAAALVFGVSMAHAGKGNAAAGKAKAEACAACHGVGGDSTVAGFPKLAGQHRDYLYHALQDYRSGKRKNPIMAEQVKTLSDADMADLAAYFAEQKGLRVKY
ncbi:cytochrome c, class IC [Thiobacillus denitrificans ATCC 25259]|uniref:Cytochrome c, class IC n=1 Tax=Thiobacillus denitrificans (strain ATCC 25259 / T1) TaxID=292415 RepID=Q3SHB0_THIDA|nr:cytochrome c [Thiobacillus denitrificans]AAZ97979.1 cytochrome c, class IC [Thiobacillus denitrificans ATCC 25259]